MIISVEVEKRRICRNGVVVSQWEQSIDCLKFSKICLTHHYWSKIWHDEVRLTGVTRVEDLLPFPVGDCELGEWEEWRGGSWNHDRTLLRFTRGEKTPNILQIAVKSVRILVDNIEFIKFAHHQVKSPKNNKVTTPLLSSFSIDSFSNNHHSHRNSDDLKSQREPWQNFDT